MKVWRLGWEQNLLFAILFATQILGALSAFDCRLFVFHPECRGQYGKRSSVPAIAEADQTTDPVDDSDLFELVEYCSRYVFAPICRGVTSKRATISPLAGNKQAIFDLLLKQIRNQEEEKNQRFGWSKVKYPVSEVKKNQDGQHSAFVDNDYNSHIRYGKRSGDLGDLDSFTSFYKRRQMYKRNAAPELDDIGDTFTSFIKKSAARPTRSADDLGLFTTFYKRNNLADLGSFSSFYKKNALLGGRYRRQASGSVDDLGAFTTFMKRHRHDLEDLDGFSSFATGKRKKRSPYSREDVRDALVPAKN